MKRTVKAGILTGVAACLTLGLTLQAASLTGRRQIRLDEREKKTYAVALESDAAPGARVEVWDAGGLLADSAVVEDGGCVLNLVPGDYTVTAGADTLSFTLRSNASVARASGDGWADGEVLHLSAESAGSLTIFRTGGAGSYRYTLSGDGGEFAGVIDYGASYAEIWRSTRLDGVPAGEYTLYENGDAVQTVEVAPGGNSVRIE